MDNKHEVKANTRRHFVQRRGFQLQKDFMGTINPHVHGKIKTQKPIHQHEGAVHFLDNGGEIPHAGLAPNFPLENVSEQKEWNAGRLSFIE